MYIPGFSDPSFTWSPSSFEIIAARSQPLLMLRGPIHAYCASLRLMLLKLESIIEFVFNGRTTGEPEDPKNRQELSVPSRKLLTSK